MLNVIMLSVIIQNVDKLNVVALYGLDTSLILQILDFAKTFRQEGHAVIPYLVPNFLSSYRLPDPGLQGPTQVWRT